jgi:hypothetical protein
MTYGLIHVAIEVFAFFERSLGKSGMEVAERDHVMSVCEAVEDGEEGVFAAGY